MQRAGEIALGSIIVCQNNSVIRVFVAGVATAGRIMEAEADFICIRAIVRMPRRIIKVDLDHCCTRRHFEAMIDVGLYLIRGDPALPS